MKINKQKSSHGDKYTKVKKKIRKYTTLYLLAGHLFFLSQKDNSSSKIMLGGGGRVGSSRYPQIEKILVQFIVRSVP